MVSEPIEFFGPKSMAEEEQSLIGLQKKLQEKKHTRSLRRLKYSCEEVYERMDNGLCIFCDELDTPGHHDLKHKGIQIFMVECDDEVSEDKEEAHQETVKNPEPFIETKTNVEPETMKTDPFIEPLKHTSALQVPDSVNDVLVFHKMDSLVKEVEESSQKLTNGNGEKVAHQLFDQMPLRKASKEKQQTEALRSELNRMLAELKAMTANREATMSKFLSQTSIPPRPPFPPPDPPDMCRFEQGLTDEIIFDKDNTVWLFNGVVTQRSKIELEVESIETGSSIQQIESSGVKDVISTNLILSNGSNPDEESRPKEASTHTADSDFGEETITSNASKSLQVPSQVSLYHLPVFDGTLPDCWIVEVDRFFELKQYENEEELDLISLSVEGAALKWFRRHRREFTDWTDIKRKLMARFGLVKGCSPPEVLPKEKLITKVDQNTDFGSKKESTNSVEITSIKGHEVKGTTVSHSAMSCAKQIHQNEEFTHLHVTVSTSKLSRNLSLIMHQVGNSVVENQKKLAMKAEIPVFLNLHEPSRLFDDESHGALGDLTLAPMKPYQSYSQSWYELDTIQSDINFKVLVAHECDMVGAVVIYEVATTFEKLAKTWKFKFKNNPERSKLMDNMFSFMEKSSEKYVTVWESHHRLLESQQGDRLSLLNCLIAHDGLRLWICLGFYNSSLEAKVELSGWKYKKQINQGQICLNGLCNELDCVVEKKKLRNVEDGVKQDKNRFSGDVRAKIFMDLEELHLLNGEGKRDARTLLMVYDAERLIQPDASPIFSDLLCVKNRIQVRLKMVLLLEFLWLILFTSKMFKSSNVPQKKNQTDQKLSSYWKLLLSWKISQNIHVSPRCVLRQEESYVKVLELIKDRDSRKRKLCKNWWFKFKLNTWPSETLHLWRKRKSEKLQILGRATHGLLLKQSFSQVLLHIQNRDYSFFGYMLVATSLVVTENIYSFSIKDTHMEGFKQIIRSGNRKTVAATNVNQNSETSQDCYLLLFLERVKVIFEIMFTVEHFENPLASVITHEVFHLLWPPEIPTKCSSPNILNLILEDKDALKEGVLLQDN